MRRFINLLSGPTLSCSRGYFTTSRFRGIRKSLKNWWVEGEKQRHQEFQSWAEFENRGFKPPEYMTSWFIEEYGKPKDVLKKDVINVRYDKFKSIDSRHTRVRQAVKNPNDILIKVHAASVNPIDVAMCGGYGKRLINFRRNIILDFVSQFSRVEDHSEFPLVLGRDFSGTVVDVGSGVTDIVPGDEVYGAQELHRLGTFSEYANAHLKCVCHKPACLSHVEAASLPYVSFTVMSALGDFTKAAAGKRALVLGGTGGIGTLAIQYLKAHGTHVSVTCGKTGSSLCTQLGADACYDYSSENCLEDIKADARFDLLFDTVGAGNPAIAASVLNKNGMYVTLKSPLLSNTDDFGLIYGLSVSASELLGSKISQNGINIKWGYFNPDRSNLIYLTKLIDSGAIKPVIHKILNFEEVPQGFDIVANGHTKGKVVINVSGLPEATKKPDVEKIIHL